MILKPAKTNEEVEVRRGLNIKPFPINKILEETIKEKIVLKVDDNITTDHIMPSDSKLLPFRFNIPYLSEFCFNTIDKDFQKGVS